MLKFRVKMDKPNIPVPRPRLKLSKSRADEAPQVPPRPTKNLPLPLTPEDEYECNVHVLYDEIENKISNLCMEDSKESEAVKKFIDLDQIFVEKLSERLKYFSYDYHKKTMGPSLLKGYFGLADSLYLQHNETFLPALRRCTTIEDVCYAFEKHKTILSEHITDVWEKSLELYEQNFSKIINVNKEYYDLPGTLIKDFLMAMRAFCVQKELSERWKDEMSRTCKLLFQIYTQIEYIKAGLNRIQGHKINLKEAGYVLFMERCYVSDILKRRYLDVFLTQKFLIVTEFDGKWYNCLDSIPIECFEIIVKPGKTTMQVNFGNANRKLYKLNFMDKKVFDRALSSFPSNNIVERK